MQYLTCAGFTTAEILEQTTESEVWKDPWGQHILLSPQAQKWKPREKAHR